MDLWVQNRIYLKGICNHKFDDTILPKYKTFTMLYQKVPGLLLLLTTSENKGAIVGQDHTSISLLQQSATRYRTVNMHHLHKSAFSTLCLVLSAMDGKIKQCACIKLCVKIGKSTTKPLKCFMRLLENII
jgi:hypothetical protein